MTFVKGLIFSNWPLKLTALGLAVVLYMGVAISESSRSWAGPVPIEVLNAPPGGALLDDPGAIERAVRFVLGDWLENVEEPSSADGVVTIAREASPWLAESVAAR